MAELKRIADGWAFYRAEIIPPNAPAVQLQESRRVFYAAVAWLLDQLLQVGDDAVSEDAGVEYLSALADEAQRFARDVGAGRA